MASWLKIKIFNVVGKHKRTQSVKNRNKANESCVSKYPYEKTAWHVWKGFYHLSAKVHLSLVTVGRSVSQEHGLLGYCGCSTGRAGRLSPANELGRHLRCRQGNLDSDMGFKKKKNLGLIFVFRAGQTDKSGDSDTHWVLGNTSRLMKQTAAGWWRWLPLTDWSLRNIGETPYKNFHGHINKLEWKINKLFPKKLTKMLENTQ